MEDLDELFTDHLGDHLHEQLNEHITEHLAIPAPLPNPPGLAERLEELRLTGCCQCVEINSRSKMLSH